MAEDEPRSPAGDDGAPAEPAAPQRRRRWVLPVLVAVLVLALLVGGWLVAATRGVDRCQAATDRATPVCDGDLTLADVRTPTSIPADLPDGLDEVARAFEAFFAQERWSTTSTSERAADGGAGEDDATTISVDGEILERRSPDGFVGLIRPGAGIARYEGERFWVPACVNGDRGWAPWTNADCVESERTGSKVVTRWASLREGSCEDAVAWWSATREDGRLTGWSLEAADRFRAEVTVNEPRSLSWPSRWWIAPAFFAG